MNKALMRDQKPEEEEYVNSQKWPFITMTCQKGKENNNLNTEGYSSICFYK